MGGAHIDRNGTMDAPYLKGSSIPGRMIEGIGGGAFNIASNLSRLGVHVTFSSPRADDNLTSAIRNEVSNFPNFKDLPVKVKGSSPSYTALKDTTGELIAALADMKLYDELNATGYLTEQLQAEIRQAEVLITDANFPCAILTAIGELINENCQWYAVATSPAKVKKLLPSLHRLHLLSMNINEASELTSITSNAPFELINGLQSLGLKNGIITKGPRGLDYFGKDIGSINLQPYPSDNVEDVTGAGDAILSGYIATTLQGARSRDALSAGLAAAKITIEVNGACSKQLSMKSIEDIMTAH